MEQKKTKLQEIKEKYDASIPEKISVLKTLVSASQNNSEEIKALKSEIHKMGGSAGSFGYDAVSDLCKEFENEMNLKIEANTINDPLWLKSIDSRIEAIEKGFKDEQSGMHRVFVFDEEGTFLKYATLVLREVGLKVDAVSRQDALFEQLVKQKPDLLIVLGSQELVSQIRSKYADIKMAVVADSASIKDADAILIKPVSATLLQEKVLTLLKGQ